MKLLQTFILLWAILSGVHSQVNNMDLNRKIPTPASGLTSKAIIEKLIKDYGLLITYQSNDPVLKYPVQIPKTDSISVNELLNVLQQNLPYEFLYRNEYIILRKKEMPKELILKGQVKNLSNPNIPIIANVFVKGENIGQSTNLQGEYALKIPPGNYTVEFSCIGFEMVVRKINLYSDLEINVSLEEKYYDVQQVEIITNKKELGDLDIGRNIERVDAKTIEQINYNNPIDALQGRVNGVWVTRVSGAPGDHQKVRIRGVNSLFAAVDPLYVVNGVQIPIVNIYSLGISDINSRDIESITVLKDVASTAYYGYQGGNGVVKIETKKGGGENQVHFTSRIGIQKMNKRYPLMNSSEFLNNMAEIDEVYPNRYKNYPRYFTYSYDSTVWKLVGNDMVRTYVAVPVDRFVYPFPHDTADYKSNDWQDELFRTGTIHEYQLALQGSKKKINYYISGNYYDHEGVVVLSNYKKYSYSANLSTTLFKNLFIDFSGFGSVQKNENNLDNYLGNKTVLQGINIEPNYNSLTDFEKSNRRSYPVEEGSSPVYDMVRTREMYAFSPLNMPNLYINRLPDGRDFFSLRNQTLDVYSNNFSLGLQYYVNQNISISNRLSLLFKDNTYNSLIRIDTSLIGSNYYNSIEKYRVLSNVADVSYSKLFVNHSVTFSATYRFYRDQVKWNVDSVHGYNMDEINKFTDGYIRGSNAIYGPSNNIVREINSFIIHGKYSYKNRYTISAFANFDRMVEGNYVDAKALFPSVALNWDISRESWLRPVKALNELSLYANWGIVGNYPLNSLSNDINAETRISDETGYDQGKYISNLANHNLKHEEIEEKNFGMRVTAFQKQLSLNINYYLKENRNLILNRDIPLYYGGGKAMINLGNMFHKGFELSIEAWPVERNRFSWNTILGYSFDKQHVKEIYQDHDTLLFNSPEILIPEFYIAREAQIGDIVGYKYEGYWTEQDEELQDPDYINHRGIKYYKKDKTSSELNEADKVVIGNSIPDFTCHWINSMRFRNITMNMHWFAVVGVDKFNATRASTYFSQVNKEIRPIVDEAMSHFMEKKFYESSFFIEDASYIRLKTLSFVYSPERKLFLNVKASFSLSFENLITLTRYKGYDPEATVYTDNNFSNNALDIGAYPAPKSVFISMNLTI